ncbi:Epididymal secretory protein E1 [Cryptotermes secundus]|uniref:Epididymal secretory protein E1 n=2 Tax=Cryptotermes secundus TaxID=105785 RepID=A0A2J7QLJ3_9NEOP|nr:Epididymal secretory protein E1 [Cryptotermes secundus]
MIRLLAFLVLATTVLATTFDKCSDEEPPPVELRVTNCNEPPCKFVRGKEMAAEVDFIPDHDITSLTPYVQAIISGLPVNYSLPQTNACKSLLDRTCPLTKDEKVTYVLKMPILSVYPPIPLTVKLALIDNSNHIVTCFKIAGKVQ